MTRRARLVLVDDDQTLISELRAVLEDCGLSVVGTADDGLSGVALCDQLRPDLAVFDVRMPGMGGTEAAAILQSRHPQLPVVLLSAYDDESIKATARECNVAGYVVKGAPIRELLAVVLPIVEGLTDD